jgi:hypothetical protein
MENLLVFILLVLKLFQAQLQKWDAARRCDQKWKRVEARSGFLVKGCSILHDKKNMNLFKVL